MASSKVSLKLKILVSSFIISVSLVLDQFFKLLAAANLKKQPGHSFLWGTVRLEYAENTGAFLSLGAQLDDRSRTLLFVIGVFVILGFCIFWLVRSAHNWMAIVALALVISGGIGNLIDRVTRGYVIDFIFMGIGPLHTGVFNIADIAITSGLIMMLYEQYRMEKETK